MFIALLWAMAPIGVRASAQVIPGADAAPFQSALALWLANDEAASLAQLSELAQSGNDAAQLLLGVIDKLPALQGPYLAHLPRAERLRLLRQPGGISGRSWLTSSQMPVAQAFRAMWTVENGVEVIESFNQLGETRAAREALLTLSTRQHAGLDDIPLETVDPELLYLLWFSANPERRTQIEALIAPNHPQRGHFGTSADAREIDDWLSSSDLAQPLSNLCQSSCPSDHSQQINCRSAAYHALDSHSGLLLMGTPVAGLVSQEQFNASPRGQSAVLRRIMLSSLIRDRRALIASMADRSVCLAERLVAEMQLYHPLMVSPIVQE